MEQRIHSSEYPVLTLPNEIVSEIFAHFLPVYPLCPASTGNLSTACLTQICRTWRDIALENPALWRAISLSGTAFPADRLAHVSEMLARSGSYPLSIQIEENPDGINHPVGAEILAAVARHRERWEHLQLCLSHQNPISRPVDGAMPLLRRVDLELADRSIYINFDSAPLLRTAILDIGAIRNVSLPWTQLTSLTLRLISFENCLDILRETTNLVHCELNLCYENVDPVVNEPDLLFLFLESFAFNNFKGVAVAGFLHIIVAPALHRLQLTERFLQPNPLDSLASFMSKSGCNLHEVCITGKRTVTQDTYAAAFPSIKKFSFSGQYRDIDSDDSDDESESD
ncbi:hypothetical protein DFH06DRAFT_1195536 [Mycena polygramma]|nr:hypothetical protein DFH06DRAFT_1195536 [Mycena polygramma]